MPIVTLLSDFGTIDSYVAQMKGVIISQCPKCQIVDITHNVERHNVPMGAFLLETAVPHFPDGSIHVAVVDPGVGGKRLPILVKCEDSLLIGPDNGLLERASRKLGFVEAFQIQIANVVGKRVSSTFHGRDVFAVTAGKLATGLRPEAVGRKVSRIVKLDSLVTKIVKRTLFCRVLHIDVFGNIITSASNASLDKLAPLPEDDLVVKVQTRRFKGVFGNVYHETRLGGMVVLRGSQGYVEIALREKNAASSLKVKQADELEIQFAS